VIAIHKRHGLAPNPLYLKGASRVGCWPCIYARKSEIKLVAEIDPGRIEILRQLEKEVAELATARYAKKGETFKSLGYQEPTWFQAPLGGKKMQCAVCEGSGICHTCHGNPPPDAECIGCAMSHGVCVTCQGSGYSVNRAGECWPIDKVVEWSRTSRGGRQYEMFAADSAAEGCMRWGLCSVNEDDEEGGEMLADR
jgi:hypothetical protein